MTICEINYVINCIECVEYNDKPGVGIVALTIDAYLGFTLSVCFWRIIRSEAAPRFIRIPPLG